jgi:flagellar L-ring protein precursor FlgH
MLRNLAPPRGVLSALTFALVALVAHRATAQRSSLYQRNNEGVIPLATSSLTYREVLPPKEIKLHDIVIIVVVESSQSINTGEFDGKKNASIDAQLKSWIELDGLNLKPAPQPDGDPRANGIYNTQFRAEGELETRQALKFNIAAEVVDIRPNGNLVLEARKRIQENDEILEASVTGIVRREDIDPRNRITSDAIAQVQVFRRTVGHVRDAYKRGWLHRLYDRFAPF